MSHDQPLHCACGKQLFGFMPPCVLPIGHAGDCEDGFGGHYNHGTPDSSGRPPLEPEPKPTQSADTADATPENMTRFDPVSGKNVPVNPPEPKPAPRKRPAKKLETKPEETQANGPAGALANASTAPQSLLAKAAAGVPVAMIATMAGGALSTDEARKLQAQFVAWCDANASKFIDWRKAWPAFRTWQTNGYPSLPAPTPSNVVTPPASVFTDAADPVNVALAGLR